MGISETNGELSIMLPSAIEEILSVFCKLRNPEDIKSPVVQKNFED
jgi:hypothetical protein